MAEAVALINGKNYAHKDIIFNWGGAPILSLSSLDCTETQVKEFSYGTGELPVGYGVGRREAVAVTFEISMTDFLALQRASGTGGILSLPPQDIPVTLANTSGPASVIVKNILITEDSFSSDVDTTDIKVPITAIASHLKWV